MTLDVYANWNAGLTPFATGTDNNKAVQRLHADKLALKGGLTQLPDDDAYSLYLDLGRAAGLQADVVINPLSATIAQGSKRWISVPFHFFFDDQDDMFAWRSGYAVKLMTLMSGGLSSPSLNLWLSRDDSKRTFVCGLSSLSAGLAEAQHVPISPRRQVNFEIEFTPAAASGSAAQLWINQPGSRELRPFGAPLPGFTSAAIDSIRLGSTAASSVTAGHMQFGRVAISSEKLFEGVVQGPVRKQRLSSVESQHLSIGPMRLMSAQRLASSQVAGTAKFYDTRKYELLPNKLLTTLDNRKFVTTESEGIRFSEGCYVHLENGCEIEVTYQQGG